MRNSIVSERLVNSASLSSLYIFSFFFHGLTALLSFLPSFSMTFIYRVTLHIPHAPYFHTYTTGSFALNLANETHFTNILKNNSKKEKPKSYSRRSTSEVGFPVLSPSSPFFFRFSSLFHRLFFLYWSEIIKKKRTCFQFIFLTQTPKCTFLIIIIFRYFSVARTAFSRASQTRVTESFDCIHVCDWDTFVTFHSPF